MGGVIRGVLTSEEKANAYFQLVKVALASEKDRPNDIILKVDGTDGLITPDIGDIGVFPHRIYHFELDLTTFMTTKVIFASEWIKSNLCSIRLGVFKSKYEQAKSSPGSGSALGNAYEQYVFNSFSFAKEVTVTILNNGQKEEKTYKGGTLRKDAPLISTATQFCDYVNKSINYEGVTIIKPTSETFPAIDFGVFDNSGKHLLLVQVTINKAKKLSMNTLAEFTPLFDIPGLVVEQLIVTNCFELCEIAWTQTKEKHLKELQPKWTSITSIAYFN